MSKLNDKAMNLFQGASQPTAFKEAFEEKEASKSRSFREEFVMAPLTREEDSAIQLIIAEENWANTGSDEQVAGHHKVLVELTTQIRAIERQNVLLHGERIQKAQEILKRYKDGAFTRWLELAYGNRQTPYRMLQYYQFFQSLTGEVRQLMQSMPKKAAYVLASRDGDQQKKIELIKSHHDEDADNIIKLVQETFPLNSQDKRKVKANDLVLVGSIRSDLNKLVKRKKHLTRETIEQIRELRGLIDELLVQNKQALEIDALNG